MSALSKEDRLYLKESCRRSNVPEKVTDPETVARASAILGDAPRGEVSRELD